MKRAFLWLLTAVLFCLAMGCTAAAGVPALSENEQTATVTEQADVAPASEPAAATTPEPVLTPTPVPTAEPTPAAVPVSRSMDTELYRNGGVRVQLTQVEFLATRQLTIEMLYENDTNRTVNITGEICSINGWYDYPGTVETKNFDGGTMEQYMGNNSVILEPGESARVRAIFQPTEDAAFRRFFPMDELASIAVHTQVVEHPSRKGIGFQITPVRIADGTASGQDMSGTEVFRSDTCRVVLKGYDPAYDAVYLAAECNGYAACNITPIVNGHCLGNYSVSSYQRTYTAVKLDLFVLQRMLGVNKPETLRLRFAARNPEACSEYEVELPPEARRSGVALDTLPVLYQDAYVCIRQYGFMGPGTLLLSAENLSGSDLQLSPGDGTIGGKKYDAWWNGFTFPSGVCGMIQIEPHEPDGDRRNISLLDDDSMICPIRVLTPGGQELSEAKLKPDLSLLNGATPTTETDTPAEDATDVLYEDARLCVRQAEPERMEDGSIKNLVLEIKNKSDCCDMFMCGSLFRVDGVAADDQFAQHYINLKPGETWWYKIQYDDPNSDGDHEETAIPETMTELSMALRIRFEKNVARNGYDIATSAYVTEMFTMRIQ